ncbi:MAG: glycoside hydrolase family 27 protein [Fimbriimonadales bacterium]|nr:glycoside hydrolase family 27 protein [Fimbriimonadales bacterium]
MANEVKPLAATPPMGWNSWNTFGEKVDAKVVCETADAMVRLGMRELGYEYVVIDDCWSDKRGRDSNGDLVPDPERFPDGIKAVADHVHSRGLKFGIYSDAANLTCAKWPGSFEHEEQDAALFASWGVDFLKYDYCHAPEDQASAIDRYRRMGDALRGCGREILFSICEWGGRAPWLWGRSVGGHMWRATGDVVDAWYEKDLIWGGLTINAAIDHAVAIGDYTGPGGWNDFDMLVVGIRGQGHTGKGNCSDIDYRTQMSMWCLFASPLMAGCDLRSVDAVSAETMLNPEVIAVDQDPLGKAAKRVSQNGPLEVWQRPLADGSFAVGLLNRGEEESEITLRWHHLGVLDSTPALVRDLWKRQDVGEFREKASATVRPHETVLWKVTLRS